MTRFTNIIVIAIVFFTVALTSEAVEAAGIEIKVREPVGVWGNLAPKRKIDLYLRNLESGWFKLAELNASGVFSYRNLPKGKYRIEVSYPYGKSRHFQHRYRYITIARERETITMVPLNKYVSSEPAKITSRRALNALKKGNRAKAARGLKDLREMVKHHRQAQSELKHLVGGVRARLLAKLPRNLRNRLETTLARTKPDKRTNAVDKFVEEVAAQIHAVGELTQRAWEKMKPGKNRDAIKESYQKSLKQTVAITRALQMLWFLEKFESDHRKNVEEGSAEIRKLSRALNASKPPAIHSKNLSRPPANRKIGAVPSGAYKDSGDGASQNKRVVFSCRIKSARRISVCRATYAGTNDGSPALIVGSFSHKTATLVGYWIESKSNQKCRRKRRNSFYWGRIRFVFNRDVKSWKGNWNYCGGPLKHSWNGKK